MFVSCVHCLVRNRGHSHEFQLLWYVKINPRKLCYSSEKLNLFKYGIEDAWRVCKCVCLPNRESYLALHMPSTFCSKFPVDEFSSNFVLWFWLNEPKVCTWNILRYTFNFNMGNQRVWLWLFICLPVCMSEKENASYVNLQRSFSQENQQTHMKWVCTIYLQHQRILKNQI